MADLEKRLAGVTARPGHPRLPEQLIGLAEPQNAGVSEPQPSAPLLVHFQAEAVVSDSVGLGSV